ncbi:arsenite S-adenosylmethyltransferase [Rubripirellula lacrimiformis]|uniref:Arsenite methyltransferase n=1 Tax=Rubripirellula lacrimiformis TaxID=1930273 RepID=A0A517NCX0_9BACT|nr:methyltransferase domain-containing protein [Rubripirellula lacrimiformis]QDT04973.1 arsenite S-adenosylmethyltransferase [Rubripirellula lacrimiformis]
MNSPVMQHRLPAEASVSQRYSAAAESVEPALCCPVQYSSELLEVIPREIIDKDYGCGDPTPYVRPGDTVLDLGSGGGKLCYIAAQVAGPDGHVIGVDCNREMLSLARKHAATVSERLGYANVDFRYGLIQDLGLDLDQLATELSQRPVNDPAGYLALRHAEDRLRRERPLVADDSVDCVLSNCVLNLVRQQDRVQLFAEIFRVLRKGGRAAISDIVCDQSVPARLQQDPNLWSGCITGAFREDEFMRAFEDAGFHGIELVKRESRPWRTVEGIEFRSVTVVAYKGKQGPCWERNQAVVYRGPFKSVEDDDGHTYRRGDRMAVCDKTFQILQDAPYRGMFDSIEPRNPIPIKEATAFDCGRSVKRDPRESKGMDYHATTEAPAKGCGDEACC